MYAKWKERREESCKEKGKEGEGGRKEEDMEWKIRRKQVRKISWKEMRKDRRKMMNSWRKKIRKL